VNQREDLSTYTDRLAAFNELLADIERVV